MKRCHFWKTMACTAVLAVLTACPVLAEDYSVVLDKVGRLQTMAEEYAQQSGEENAAQIALSFTRTGTYNSSLWQLIAGMRDADFEAYVRDNDPELTTLQGMELVTLPNGQDVDFGHLMAAMNLVCNGIPITGSWGGDCQQLAQQYLGQASDVDGYMEQMRQTFAIPGGKEVSVFGAEDLRADLDSIIVGARVAQGERVAEALQDYYNSETEYDRCYEFIAMSFGNVDTADVEGFRQEVYETLVEDAGMQLLLFINHMWSSDGWQIDAEAEAPVRAAAYLFADYLGNAVNHERVKSDSETLMSTSADQALISALSVLGYDDAAKAAEEHYASQNDPQNQEGDIHSTLADASNTLKDKFDVNVFRIILFAVGAVALLVLLGSLVVLIFF